MKKYKKNEYWTPKFSYGKKTRPITKRVRNPTPWDVVKADVKKVSPPTLKGSPDSRNSDIKIFTPNGTLKKIIKNKALFNH